MEDNFRSKQPETASDNRGKRRQRVLRRGRIVMNDLRATFDVLIRDLSENGAKLKLGEAWTIPDRFELEVLYPNGTVEKRFSCEKRWQRGISLGAQFMDTRPGE